MRWIELLAFSFVSLLSCRPTTQKEFAAKVGNSVLLESSLDSSYGLEGRSPLDRTRFIRNWVESEALYQKAIASGLREDAKVQQDLDQLIRQFLIQSFIEREVDRRLSVSREDIESYYKAHASEYVLAEDEIKTEYFLTRDKDKAKDLEAQFEKMSRLRKKDFLEIVTQTASDSDVVGEREFLPRAAFEEKIAKYVFLKNATDEIIGPILTAQGYYSLWHVVEIRPAGSSKPLSAVEQEIEQRLRIIRRKEKLDELIAQAKADIPVEYGTRYQTPQKP